MGLNRNCEVNRNKSGKVISKLYNNETFEYKGVGNEILKMT